MSKRLILLLGLVCCTAIAGLVFAEADFDADAVKGMSKADRMAAQQAYKADLEQAARARGWEPKAKGEFEGSGRTAGPPPKDLGSITYHSGILGPCGGCGTSESVGNRYDFALNPANTAVGPVMMSGSITGATFDMIDVGGSAVFFSVFWGLAGPTAASGTSLSVPAAPGVNNVIMVSPIGYTGSTFLAGIWNFTAGSDTPAVATGTIGGQGYHGMSINDISGTGFATIGALNGAISIKGNVVTPVELLNFDVE